MKYDTHLNRFYLRFFINVVNFRQNFVFKELVFFQLVISYVLLLRAATLQRYKHAIMLNTQKPNRI